MTKAKTKVTEKPKVVAKPTPKVVPKSKVAKTKKKASKPKVDMKPKRRVISNPRALSITRALFAPEEVIPQQDQGMASAVIFSKIMEETFSKVDISLKTELNDTEVLVYAQADVFSDKYEFPLLKDLVENIMGKKVSYKRKGRKEFENIAKASFNSIYQSEQEKARQSIPDHLLGRTR